MDEHIFDPVTYALLKSQLDTDNIQNDSEYITGEDLTEALDNLYESISELLTITTHQIYVHSETPVLELGRATMLIYGKLFILHGIVTVTETLSTGAIIYDLPDYDYGMANVNNNPIVAADNSSYTTVGLDNTNKTLKVTYNGGMQTGRFEMLIMGWIN